jgi:hypothetical protein
MADVDEALLMPAPRALDFDEAQIPLRSPRLVRSLGAYGATASYPTPGEILSRIAGLILIFLWIACVADCLVDALGN